MTPYIGAIFSFGFNFAPNGWALCDGRLLAIAQYEALYALIGTTYGGNGTTTFGIPNLQGRVPIGEGQGPGLSNYALGQTGGAESLTLTLNNMPAHTHPVLTAQLPISAAAATLPKPDNAYFAVSDTNIGNVYSGASTPSVTMAPSTGTTGTTGTSGPLPIEILNQYQTVNYSIALFGIFPQRN
jgi:microcystin-dependent protein